MPNCIPSLPELALTGTPPAPSAVPAGTWFALQVELSHVPRAWVSERDSAPLNLSYHWLTPAGGMVVFGGLRTPVPPAAVDAPCLVRMLVSAPLQAGPYLLEITGVTESRHWWESVGVPTIRLAVDVRPLDRSCDILMLAGGSGFRNTGDEVLLSRAAQLCRQQAPAAMLVLSANNPEVAGATLEGLHIPMVSSLRQAFFGSDAHYNACDEVFRNRWAAIDLALPGGDLVLALNAANSLDFIDRPAAELFLRTLSAARRLVVHGGGILTSATRSRLWEMALLCRLAHRVGLPVALRSHQIGPFDNDEDRALAREMFDGAAFISTRDRGESALAVLATGSTTPAHEDVDDAFVPVTAGHRSAELMARYALARGGYIAACYRRNPSVGLTDTTLSAFVRAVAHAAARTGLPTVLLPMGPFDLPVLEEIRQRLQPGSRVIVPTDWLADAPAIAQDSRLLVSVPHHPLVFALQAGTPVLSPVEGPYYHAKNRGSMRLFGLENFVVDVSTPGGESQLLGALDLLIDHDVAVRRYIAQRLAQLPAMGAAAQRGFASFLTGPALPSPGGAEPEVDKD